MRRRRRSPRSRLLLIVAALTSLVIGYYFGQYWQRRPLAGLSAVMYPAGQAVAYPDLPGLAPEEADATTPWRLFITADTGVPACREFLTHYAFVINRLAAAPSIQSRLRLTVLAYDQPDAAAIEAFAGGSGWAEVVSGAPAELDKLAGQLGILPAGDDWCGPLNDNAILVSPRRESWALIPREPAAIMARNIRTIIEFVE